MANYQPVNSAGLLPFTMVAGAAITAGQIVFISAAGQVSPTAGANGLVVGVAAHDQATVGGLVAVWPLHGCVHESVAPAGVAAGDPLITAAAGGIATGVLATVAANGTLVGIAHTTAGAAAKARWTASR